MRLVEVSRYINRYEDSSLSFVFLHATPTTCNELFLAEHYMSNFTHYFISLFVCHIGNTTEHVFHCYGRISANLITFWF